MHMAIVLLRVIHPTEAVEEEDSKEKVEVDWDQYPQLPENVCELWLQRWEAIMRQYMTAAWREHHWEYV